MVLPWLRIAGELLKAAGREFSPHVRNDWKWPADWSQEQRVAMAAAILFSARGREPERFVEDDCETLEWWVRGEFGPPNSVMMLFLGEQLAATANPTGE